MIDLDEIQRHIEHGLDDGGEYDGVPTGVTDRLITELRAARRVVDACDPFDSRELNAAFAEYLVVTR